MLERLPFWVRKTLLALMALGVVGVGAHDVIDDYRELSSPQPAVVLNHERYIQQWVPEHREPSTQTSVQENGDDEYVHLSQILEDEERLNKVDISQIDAAPTLRLHRCLSKDPGASKIIGLLEMPPGSDKAMVVNQSALSRSAASSDLICDGKETWRIRVDVGQIFYAERVKSSGR